MRKLLLSSVILSICGCGTQDAPGDWHVTTQSKPEPVVPETPVSPLKEILDDFLFDCGTTYGADVSASSKLEYIRYGDPPTKEDPHIAGMCYTWVYEHDGSLYKSYIVIKKMDTEICEKALLYHELGHCILGLDHTDQASQDLMAPSLLEDSYYEMNWDSLVKRLCKMYKE